MSKLTAEQELVEFISALEVFLKQQFNYRTQVCQKGLGPTVMASRHAVALYVRYKPAHFAVDFDRPIVITRMGFHKTRHGHGRALLSFLVEQAEKFGLGSVVLESTNEESSAFAQKFGFIKCSRIRRNWHVPIPVLSDYLEV